MNVKKIGLVVSVLFLVTVIAMTLLCWFVIKPDNTLKTAVAKSEIAGTSYILCKPVATTGFHWEVLENEGGTAKRHLCNIIGANPSKELNFSQDFMLGGNVFVFYVVDVDGYYSDKHGDSVDYAVSGWDVLMPLKHGRLDSFFESKRYITTKDTK